MDEKYVARRNEEHEEKKKKRKRKALDRTSPRSIVEERRKRRRGKRGKNPLCKKKKKEEGIKIKNRYICSDADSFHGRNSSDRDIRVESEISRLPRAFNERSKTIRC